MTLSPGANSPQVTQQIIQVALDVPLPRLFDYLAPDATAADTGRRVEVVFGRRRQIGILLGLAGQSEVAPERLKAVSRIDRDAPPLPDELIALARFAAAYYHHPLGATLLGALPPALRQARFRPPPPAAWRLSDAGAAALADLPARAPAQQRLAAQLRQGPVARAALAPGAAALLRRWEKAGWVTPCGPASTPAAATETVPPVMPAATPAQAAALAALQTGLEDYSASLLFGVTGSGKTEVYLRLAATVLAAGRQVLFLVPEIHLTPQLTERVAARFPDRTLVSLHSALADGERLTAWQAAAAGTADIVLGTRLAVFAPLPRLGLILVDEEHDGSYKQTEGLRYSARDLAVWRARQRDVPVVLGSATPSLETWHNAAQGRYRRIDLPQRAHPEARLPAIRLVDSRTDRPRHGLTQALTEAIGARLARGEQSLVFINRRGYAPTLTCAACGFVAGCPRCSTHRVLHRVADGHRLRCHQCGLDGPVPATCPQCGSLDLRPAGQGTQRVEEALTAQFPAARILRVDRDSTRGKGRFAAMRRAVDTGGIDILVGTQLLAKGHDFPNVTLVGVINADFALQAPDFRAGERLFAQLMQVAGRAGRADKAGEVLVQTAWPQHPLYAALVAHDFARFAAYTLEERRAAQFPPLVQQAVLRAEADQLAQAIAFLEQAKALAGQTDGPANKQADAVLLFDPVPALLPRIARRERAQLLIQSHSRGALRDFLHAWMESLYALRAPRVRWSLDVDPIEF